MNSIVESCYINRIDSVTLPRVYTSRNGNETVNTTAESSSTTTTAPETEAPVLPPKGNQEQEHESSMVYLSTE